MKIYHVIEAYECSTIITEDITKVLEVLQGEIDSNIIVEIWEDGKNLFTTKRYDEKEYNFDDIYTEIMSFIN